MIEDTSKVISKANQALQILEKYKKVLDTKISILNEYEFSDTVTLDNVINCIERIEQVMVIKKEVENAVFELGEDGRLIEMQLQELIDGVAAVEVNLIKDYLVNSKKSYEKVLQDIKKISVEGVIKSKMIAKLLGYNDSEDYEEVAVYPRGYRVLSKIPKVPSTVVENLVKSYKSFQHILVAEIDSLVKVEGIGDVRAKNIKQTLKRIQDQYMFDNVIY